MDLVDRLREISACIPKQLEPLQTEEAINYGPNGVLAAEKRGWPSQEEVQTWP